MPWVVIKVKVALFFIYIIFLEGDINIIFYNKGLPLDKGLI